MNEFEHLPLHDALVKSMQINWEKRSLTFLLDVFSEVGKSAIPHSLQFFGVKGINIPMENPWGPSSYINGTKMVASLYSIEMQTGDVLAIEADGVILERPTS